MSGDLSRRTEAIGAVFKVLIGVVVAAVLGLLMVGVLRLIDLSSRGDEQREALIGIAKTTKAYSALLVECSTPPEERKPPVKIEASADDCFQRTTRQTQKAVAQIGDISVIAAACGAANPGDVPGTRRCVEKAIAEALPPKREKVPK